MLEIGPVKNNHFLDQQFSHFMLKVIHVVLVKSCRQSKHTAAHLLPRQKMWTVSSAQAKDADTSFALATDAKGNLQPTIYVYEKD